MNQKKESKAPPRRRYRTADGESVPGVTTVTGLLAKPSLVRWANKLGLQGIDAGAYTERTARVGSLAHAMISAALLGEDFAAPDAAPEELEQARRNLAQFLAWREGHSLRPVHCESAFVSERLRYGGTVDCYCVLDGEPVLLDFKTGRSIYPEYFVQLAAYAQLLREQGFPVQELRVLRLGGEGESWEEKSVRESERWFSVFECLLRVYYLKKELGWRI